MHDDYGIFITSEETAQYIVKRIRKYGSIFLPWTDGQGSQLDLLFTLPYIESGVQRGLQHSEIIIGVSGASFFGFDKEEKYVSYIAEKLHLPRESSTTELLTDFINLILKQL